MHEPASAIEPQRITGHRGDDDLLTAGLGAEGLRATAPPAFADAAHPAAAELRRRAIWSNWRGIADLSPGGGYGRLYGSFASMPGREYSALARVPGARHPHRVLVQVPDAFDAGRRCVVVAPSSGSRGIYGAIAVAAPWALPKGCAVAYTDKGAGTDYVDLDAGLGVRLDGTPARLDAAGEDLAFAPHVPAGAGGIAFKHAHSQDNPEADWGRHVKQAAEFALVALARAFPQDAPFTFGNTRVIAVGVSNGGGAVLRAAELEGDWLDAVVAGEPNVYVDGHGGRPFYDFATEAALLMPCALPHASPRAPAETAWRVRCAMLAAAGWLEGADALAQARSAHARMRAAGWTGQALEAGASSVDLNLWRAVAATYASAYGRHGVGEHPCGFAFSVQDAGSGSHPATPAERGAWWSDASGIPPGNGVGLVDPHLAPPDLALPGLLRLRALYAGQGEEATRVREGIAATRAAPPREGLPVLVVHGTDDGLIPPAFTSAPYVAAARAAGCDGVRYWQVRNGGHFDAFLAVPAYGARHAPMLPYVHAALDRVSAYLDGRAALPADAVIDARGRGAGVVEAAQLPMP
ncbi:hydrogenase [Pseudoxanthomonas broegbernensis]|uniref:Hydrogenase n=1 Tax=Pseudoxanthomonas broegbernensis TaxID=83619 RepID=A0A7V8GP74_9GAMM|nr:3-hydroxybutyrate oligomer hydrolase family protein [Pseudoxanthomonas broegbernensis]KAF1687537.1 hydrogenase [Pseudoxanthomonas broegbernensis]MBB6064545.1 hydroxybutyrate-dimer hydrolase [Pseudoxanthomonas broegbernensis]